MGASVMALQPVVSRGAALSTGPGAAFDLADLFVDDNRCYYVRQNGRITLLTGATGVQVCAPASG